MSPVYPFEWLEQLTGFNTGFEIRVFILLDGLPSRVNKLLLPKALVLSCQDPAFAPSPVRQNSSTTGRSGVGLWLSEAIFYAYHKEHLPDTGRLSLVSPLGITTLGTTSFYTKLIILWSSVLLVENNWRRGEMTVLQQVTDKHYRIKLYQVRLQHDQDSNSQL
jgi:hypothetical protein